MLGCQQWAVNRRLNEAVAAGRAKSSATWKVGNVSERVKVRRCTAVEDLVYQDGNFGPYALRNTQPVKDDECVRDMVEATQVENQPRGCVEDLLQTTHVGCARSWVEVYVSEKGSKRLLKATNSRFHQEKNVNCRNLGNWYSSLADKRRRASMWTREISTADVETHNKAIWALGPIDSILYIPRSILQHDSSLHLWCRSRGAGWTWADVEKHKSFPGQVSCFKFVLFTQKATELGQLFSKRGWHSTDLRSACRRLLVVSRIQLDTFGRRAFAVVGPTVWNALGNDLRDPDLSIASFGRLLKTHLFFSAVFGAPNALEAPCDYAQYKSTLTVTLELLKFIELKTELSIILAVVLLIIVRSVEQPVTEFPYPVF